MKFKIACWLSLVLLIALFVTVQKAPAQIPCGPTVTPLPTLFVNWPQFHYNLAHSGCNPYESILGPDNVRNLVLDWKYITFGGINSSPAVANGRVYVASVYVYALNASTGALMWSYSVVSDSSPAVANGVVYVGIENAHTGSVLALNAGTGALIWSMGRDQSLPRPQSPMEWSTSVRPTLTLVPFML